MTAGHDNIFKCGYIQP